MLGKVRIKAVRFGNLPPLLIGRLFMFLCESAALYKTGSKQGLAKGQHYDGKTEPGEASMAA